MNLNDIVNHLMSYFGGNAQQQPQAPVQPNPYQNIAHVGNSPDVWGQVYRGGMDDTNGKLFGGVSGQVGPFMGEASYGNHGLNLGVGYSPVPNQPFPAIQTQGNNFLEFLKNLERTTWTP